MAAGYPLSHGLLRAPTTSNNFFPLNERRKCTYHTASCRDVPAATNFGDESCWGNFWVRNNECYSSGRRPYLLVVNSSLFFFLYCLFNKQNIFFYYYCLFFFVSFIKKAHRPLLEISLRLSKKNNLPFSFF